MKYSVVFKLLTFYQESRFLVIERGLGYPGFVPVS